MQTHLKKLFPGTTGVKLGPGEMSITALCSDYGETFQLDHPVDIDCAVEVCEVFYLTVLKCQII